jgi:hypothetical protein
MNKRLNLISIIAGILLLMPWTTSDATEGDWRHNDSQTIQDAIALLESDTPAELTDELSALRTAYDAFETMRLAYDPTPPDPPAPPDPPEPPPTGSDPVLSSVGTSWTQVTPGMPLLVHENTNAYSGGVFCHGRWYILGGGHANSYNDAVAMLDVSTFSTVGFWEEFQSTADYLGVTGIFRQ